MTPKEEEIFGDLREMVKKNDSQVYNFCFFMLSGDLAVDDVVTETFRDFGTSFKAQRSRSHPNVVEPLELQIQLFMLAWNKIQDALAQMRFGFPIGRDTRLFKRTEENLLVGVGDVRRSGSEIEAGENRWLERFSALDPELRAPIILKDILKMGDEEVARILRLRWGVYRQRLHRGRLELRDRLTGKLPIGKKFSRALRT